MYLWLKGFHVVSIVLWYFSIFAMTLLMRRMAVLAEKNKESDTAYGDLGSLALYLFKGSHLLSVIVIALGVWMLTEMSFWLSQPWMHIKLTLVLVFLSVSHFLGAKMKKMARGGKGLSSKTIKLFETGMALIFFAVVLLGVTKYFS